MHLVLVSSHYRTMSRDTILNKNIIMQKEKSELYAPTFLFTTNFIQSIR